MREASSRARRRAGWRVSGPCELALGSPCGGATGQSVRTKCYMCGRSACEFCSFIVTLRKRRVRLCADCVEQEVKNIIRLVERDEKRGGA